MSKSIENMTTKEVEEYLAKKKKDETEAVRKEREEYERERDVTVQALCTAAIVLSKELSEFWEQAHAEMQAQNKKLEKYGKLRKNSKGGFHLTSTSGKFKIKYAYNSISDYDERANKAEELLKDFLQDTIKKKDKTVYNIIMSLLERNNAGQLEFSRISNLYKYEDNYTDPRWKEALKLFKESFQVRGSKMQLYFYKLNDKNVFELINLNFSSI